MTPFTTLMSIIVPMREANLDTDIIIPSREMKTVAKSGLAGGLFAGRRYLAGTRVPDPQFVLNQPQYVGAVILAGGANFGCGSSREHAVWALAEYGFRCIVAPSFSPIFFGNCIANGVLPAVIEAAVDGIATVDLVAQTVMANSVTHRFEIDQDAKAMLLGGLDAIDLTLQHAASIAAWQAVDRVARPWIYFDKVSL